MSSLKPEIIFGSNGVELTNTLLATIAVDLVLVILVIIIAKNIKKTPGFLQSITEMGIGYLYDLTEQISGPNTKKIFPWFASFFIVIFFSNIVGLLPGFGTIGFFEEVPNEGKTLIPLLRGSTSDFNMTLALATVSIVMTHVIAIQAIGVKEYLKRYFSLNPIFLFVGILEIVSEASKLFSLSFRLFGNIYAGEVVLATISGLFAFGAPIPFILSLSL